MYDQTSTDQDFDKEKNASRIFVPILLHSLQLPYGKGYKWWGC